MKPINCIVGRAACYAGANVDTDQIVPARFLSRPRSAGYGLTLFHDARFDDNGNERPAFVLNRTEFRDAKIIVAGHNFGCGSSREQAVWALQDYGVECVIAVSFSDIFRNNALENGLLPVCMTQSDVSDLHRCVNAMAPCDIEVDLAAQRVVGPDGAAHGFDFDAVEKRALMQGQSKIDATLTLSSEIDSFERQYRNQHPWLT